MKINNRSGFALIEALIAGTLVLVIALAVGYFVTSAKSVSITIEGSSECQGRVQQTVASFSDHNNALQVNNWHPRGGETKPSYTDQPDHYERFLAAPLWTTPANNPSNLNNFLLINNATNWALYLQQLSRVLFNFGRRLRRGRGTRVPVDSQRNSSQR